MRVLSLRLIIGVWIFMTCTGNLLSQGQATGPGNTPKIIVQQMPEAFQGFWVDEDNVIRFEIREDYFGVDDRIWTYDTISVQGPTCTVTIKDAANRKKTYFFSQLYEGEMIVKDNYLMKTFSVRVKKEDSSFKKIGIEDLPSNYFGYWVAKDDKKKEISEVRRDGIVINDQFWRYRQIMWLEGKYRITLWQNHEYLLWIPYWINGEELTGIINPNTHLKRQIKDTPYVVYFDPNDPNPSPTPTNEINPGPRKIEVEEMPVAFFGQWGNRNGEWIFDIQKKYIVIGQKAYEYGSIKQENDLYLLTVIHWENNRQHAEIKSLTFRFLADYWMEVTEDGELYQALTKPHNEYFQNIDIDDLPNELLNTWQVSGTDSIRLSTEQKNLNWEGKALEIEQIFQYNGGYQFTCYTGDTYQIFRLDLAADDILLVSTNEVTYLFSQQAPVSTSGDILKIVFSVLVVGGLISWLLLRWRTKKIQQKEVKKRRQVELELKALRSQMNPHFLFNSLNSIQNLINKQDTDQANHYLSRFSRLMRKVLNNSESPLISLEEEVALLQLYCELEALRFDFDFDIQLDPELDAYTTEIPSMLIQPFVENAILHGIEPAVNKGEIKVSFIRSKELLCCRIEDNGIGIEQSQLLGKNKVKGNSFGIRLAEERLAMIQTHYGMDLKIEIQDKSKLSKSGSGTKIEIYLPSNLS